MEFRDLREWIEAVRALGELREVRGAHWDVELGTIVDRYQRRMGLPALLFDEIGEYPAGWRVLANTLTSMSRLALTLGLAPTTDARGLVMAWRQYARQYPTVPWRQVANGPVNEVVQTGDAVNLLRFPSPRWHEKDGGRYLGTGCVILQRDPDSGWVNMGVYRVQVHDSQRAGLYISPGKHGRLIMERYWARGKPCPVAVSLGHDPVLFLVAGLEVPYGVSELEVAGGLRGEPVEVIPSEFTGLPIPARSEAVIEGEIHPGEMLDEGPFGEWLGYYAGGTRPAPVIRVTAIRHRRAPILMGNLPAKPPNDDTYYRGFLRSAAIWSELEGAGIPGVSMVWCHEAGGSRMFTVVALKQMFAGHAKQAGLIAAECYAGGYANRWTIVVDDDVDPTDTDEVIWVMCSRVDPREDVTVLAGGRSTPLDPMSYPPDKRNLNARVVIDACRPWGRDFPEICEASPALQAEIVGRWRDRLPEIAD
jgi:4-hydroxy-3-polyprenylbenzoate decarboxylase